MGLGNGILWSRIGQALFSGEVVDEVVPVSNMMKCSEGELTLCSHLIEGTKFEVSSVINRGSHREVCRMNLSRWSGGSGNNGSLDGSLGLD